MTTYTREQLEAMDEVLVGKVIDEMINPEDANGNRVIEKPYWYWLTGNGMVALMGWCFDHDWNVSVSDATELKWQAVLKPNVHGGFTAEADTPPRALAIAFVVAMQEHK